MKHQDKYHINFGKKRTTITVDTILSDLMAVKFGVEPGTDEAKVLIREWLQATIPEKIGTSPFRKNASQFARRYLIEEIADKELMTKRIDYLVKFFGDKINRIL